MEVLLAVGVADFARLIRGEETALRIRDFVQQAPIGLGIVWHSTKSL
ncbi:MAG: hypothetical protein HZY76_12140 [Anaerolineae bacterium]|nr:MAG: hypothetical protein HZY76_12140 [Anaerolineae bacterium]